MSNVTLQVACNDPGNGSFIGRAPHVEVGELLSLYARDLQGLKFSDCGESIRCARVTLEKRGPDITWYGNWCWNLFVVSLSDACRLLKRLKEYGYEPTEGTVSVWDVWDSDFTEASMREAIEREMQEKESNEQ